MLTQKTFIQLIKGKIIVALVLAIIALSLAWITSKFVFEEMVDKVERISTPSQRLRIVNSLSIKIIAISQLQKTGDKVTSLKETKQLLFTIDTLSSLYKTDSIQLERLISVKNLLKERQKLIVNYLQVREGLVNSEMFAEQVKSVNKLVEENSKKTDSAIRASEKRTLTTTIYDLDNKPKTTKGFLAKLFGKKKEENSATSGINIINEEVNVKIDTVKLAKQDSLLQSIGKTIQSIEKNQRIKSERFLDQEAHLAAAGDLLINQMLSVLKEVESEAVKQIEEATVSVELLVNKGVRQISIIILVFFVIALVLLYFILTDITKNNEYRIALEKAKEEADYHSKAKERFLSNMSHEIRTPLQAIIGYAEQIKNQEKVNKKDVDAIFYSSEHLLQIVNEILDYNRIVSGNLTFSADVFKIEDLLNEVVSVMKLQATNKGIKLFTDFDLDQVSYIKGDSFRLKQILYNLIGNAVKFTQKGYVALGASAKKQNNFWHFTFTIEDTGIGMSDEDLNRVFNEFEQASTDVKTVNYKQGTGLGLSITKNLIEGQGGRINVKSKLTEGSSFSVFLRFLAAEIQDQENTVSTNKTNILHNFDKKVWIVDDDQFILDLCSVILTNKGIAHTCFNSAQALLNKEWDIDVKYVLTDLRMPEISGTQLLHQLKNKIPSDVKIIALTAQALGEEREKIKQAGFDGLLLKPFKEEQLLSLFNDFKTNKPLINQDFDENALLKMINGDKEQLALILKQFTADTIKDKNELELAMQQNNKENVSLLAHRIAGRTAQIGFKEIASEFRKIEIELNTKDLDKALNRRIETLLENLIIQLDELDNLN